MCECIGVCAGARESGRMEMGHLDFGALRFALVENHCCSRTLGWK